jgi:uncharacterized protein YuzE
VDEDIIEGLKNEAKVNYDPESDAVYIFIKEGIEEDFIEVADGIRIELNENEEVIGIEILNASKIFEALLKNEKKKGCN